MMIRSATVTSLSLAAAVYAQRAGVLVPEVHPVLSWQNCGVNGCTIKAGSVTLDSNWRWLHTATGATNCYTENIWDATLCPEPIACASNCALEGANYGGTYGISTSGNAVTLKFKTGNNIGSRVYLMASDTKYELFKLKNREFTFDVDVRNLGCGLNGALHFSQMAADGGMANNPGNLAGAKYGTGYCDAKCPHDLKFINGKANLLNWTPTSSYSGEGLYGACCNEMAVWDANSISTALTHHGCTQNGLYACSGSGCSVCDRPGCDFNPYRLGDTQFYGPGKTINTSSKFTVTTQFLTVDGTDTGALKEIRRRYKQNGVVIANSSNNSLGYSSITAQFCAAQKTAFGEVNTFANNGGFAPMSAAFDQGMVLAMSIWDDPEAHMLWLNSNYPAGANPSSPGVARGTCPVTSGDPPDVEVQQVNASVTFSNIKYGTIGSTL